MQNDNTAEFTSHKALPTSHRTLPLPLTINP